MRNKLLATLLATAFAATTAVAQQADGEVTKVDRAAERITLKHNGVKNLEMPAMSMAFRVADPRLLDSVGVGDKVRFSAQKVNGNYTVTAISKTP